MKKKNGFTLFELLVSISIIGILIALASVNFSAAQRKARDSRRIQDLRAIQSAMEQYYSSATSYPTSLQLGQPIRSDTQTFLESLPGDPKTGTNYSFPLGLTASTYCVCADLENDVGNANSSCSFATYSNNGPYFCVRNQQ